MPWFYAITLEDILGCSDLTRRGGLLVCRTPKLFLVAIYNEVTRRRLIIKLQRQHCSLT